VENHASQKVLNRWLIVAGAIVIQLCLGVIYAWSAFTKKLTESPYDFSKTKTQVIFSIALVTFAVIMALIAGRWQRKVGPRIVAITGGIVLGLGYLLAGLSGSHFWGIMAGIGLLGGAGVGLVYVCPIATLVKWFPDKKGFITGLGVAGFGFGALIWIKLTSGFEFGPVNLTPGWKGLYGAGWTVNQVFVFYGILLAAFITLGSLVLINPPAGWLPAGWHPDTSKAASSGGIEFTELQMVKTAQFWILFITYTAGSMAGLMVIGVIKLFGIDALTAQNGMEIAKANAITGTAMGLFYALCNGFGRIAWGFISDKTGRKNALVILSAIQGVTMLLFYSIGKFELGLYLGAALIGFNYGGCFALFPAATADLFGNKSLGTNYPWLFLAYGVGGIIGPVLGGAMGDAKAWMWAFIPAGVACLLVAALVTRLKTPTLKA